MYSTTLKPDINKIKRFVVNLNVDDTRMLNASEGIPAHLDYMGEVTFNRLTECLKTALEKYKLEGHYDELLYIILQKNEQIRERYDAYWQNYQDDLTSREIAQFLLAYKESKPNQLFQLVARPITGSVAIKDQSLQGGCANNSLIQLNQESSP